MTGEQERNQTTYISKVGCLKALVLGLWKNRWSISVSTKDLGGWEIRWRNGHFFALIRSEKDYPEWFRDAPSCHGSRHGCWSSVYLIKKLKVYDKILRWIWIDCEVGTKVRSRWGVVISLFVFMLVIDMSGCRKWWKAQKSDDVARFYSFTPTTVLLTVKMRCVCVPKGSPFLHPL